jgi:two-component system, LytTR family, sensor kinase
MHEETLVVDLPAEVVHPLYTRLFKLLTFFILQRTHESELRKKEWNRLELLKINIEGFLRNSVAAERESIEVPIMTRKINGRTILIHAALWGAYVALEYLANVYHISDGSEAKYLRSILLTLPLIMIPTYFVVLVVVPRYLMPGRIVASAISFLLIIVFVFYGRVLWLDIMSHFELVLFSHIPMAKIFKNVIRDYSVIALAVCIYLLGDWRQKQKLNEELITAQAEAELKLLKGQLHPHFLFNTLNNIYSLALVKSDMTANAILKLTDLLDYLVYRANSKSVPISKEIQLINTYLDLESLRHENNLVVERNIKTRNLDTPIAPLIMLPFVENCFKHGGPGSDGIFKIQIAILFDNNTLSFHIENAIRPLAELEVPGQGGVGLNNIRKRLNLIYPERHKLEIDSKSDYFSVDLTISYSNEV